MLYPHKVADALAARQDDFQTFDSAWRANLRDYTGRLRGLAAHTAAEVCRAARGQQAVDVAYEGDNASGRGNAPGALPSLELDEMKSVVVPFAESVWSSHEAARVWAIKVLRGRTTFAADGSQILPGRELSLPVAGVQIAWFENDHVAEGSYRKEVEFAILSPEELMRAEDINENAGALVSFRRFQLEAEAIQKFVERRAGWRARGERMPVAFLDGTLLPSYPSPRVGEIQASYTGTIIDLIEASRQAEVPVVGFIDHSYARDLVNLLRAISKHDGRDAAHDDSNINSSGDETARARQQHHAALYDAQILHAPDDDKERDDEHSTSFGDALLPRWGDRTIFWRCERQTLKREFQDAAGNPLVGFVYLQTTAANAPARLDIPAWVYEQGLLDELVDAVRAECVVGNGYPYAIETADEAACLSARDRQQFLSMVGDFAARGRLDFHVARKALSKAHRR